MDDISTHSIHDMNATERTDVLPFTLSSINNPVATSEALSQFDPSLMDPDVSAFVDSKPAARTSLNQLDSKQPSLPAPSYPNDAADSPTADDFFVEATNLPSLTSIENAMGTLNSSPLSDSCIQHLSPQDLQNLH